MLSAMLGDPDATVNEVIAEYDGEAEEVRSWWPYWSRPAEKSSSV